MGSENNHSNFDDDDDHRHNHDNSNVGDDDDATDDEPHFDFRCWGEWEKRSFWKWISEDQREEGKIDFGFAKKLWTILTNIHLMNLGHGDDNTDGTIMIQGREKDQLTSYIHSFFGMFLQNGHPQD